MSQRLLKAIEVLVNRAKSMAGAKRRFLNRVRNSPDRGTKGKINWSREELHER